VSSNPWISPELGFSKGFDNFSSLHRLDADQVVASAERKLDRFEQTSDRSFFLYLHFMDPHNPYEAHPESEHLFSEDISSYFNFNYSAHANTRIRLYDGEILNVDINIGKFLESLKRRGLYDSTKIIIIADHGEQFREHGKAGHGRYLYNEEVRVPLILKTGDQPQVIDDVVSNIDVVPTIFEFIGLVPPTEYPGISLINTASRKIRAGVFSETYRDYPQQAFITNSADKIIFDVRFDRTGKLVRTLRGLYNFSDDKLEQIPLLDDDLQREMTTKLENEYQLARSLKSDINRSKTAQIPSLLGTKLEKQTPRVAPEPDETPVSSELLNQLKSLGYIGK
jgi:arylsulfatase A-like enzyme